MRLTVILFLGFLVNGLVFSQEIPDGPDFPAYPVTAEMRLKSSVKLPAKVNLAKSKYFPPIIDQFGWSCNQSSSVGYLLTYELNRLRNADASLPENRYPPFFVWNFLNGTKSGTGVSYFDSWEIIKAVGTPSEAEYPNQSDLFLWLSGFQNYQKAMKNRVLRNWSLTVGTPEGLQLLKRYLYDHFDGTKFGGMANFQIASGGMNLHKLPPNSYDEGASYIPTFGTYVGHALTVVGYNDSIRLDRNGDGQYSNTIDINGDRVVDLNDYEKGALIVANTWGRTWGDDGFAYVPYHLLGLYGREGGLWNKSVHIVDAVRTVDPILSMRVELSHTNRGSVRIMAGISNDPDAAVPEHVLEYPMFNFQGGQSPFYTPGLPDTSLFELGLDLSPLADFVESDGPVRIFLIIDEKDGFNRYSGMVRSMAVYNSFLSPDSTLCNQRMVPVTNNGRTFMSVVRPLIFNRIEIKEVPKLFARPGEYVSVQMEVAGAVSPYVWELVPEYRNGFSAVPLPDHGGTIIYNGQFGNPVTRLELPFDFRFYGAGYDHFSVTEDGEILFDQEDRGYPYVIDTSLVFRSVRKINGFGRDLDYYMPGNSISWSGSDTLLAVTWKAIVPTVEGGETVTMVCEVRPDGRIRYIYDKPEVMFPSGVARDLGVSNGDSWQYHRVVNFNPDRLQGVNCLSINPYLNPLQTKFDQTGWLFCQPDQANTLYEVRVRVVDKNNRTAYSTIRISTADLSSVQLLGVGFPNPFVTDTRLRLTVSEKAMVVAEIFDIRGARIAELCREERVPAEYELVWNGRGESGEVVRPGVYFCRVLLGSRKESVKLVKLR